MGWIDFGGGQQLWDELSGQHGIKAFQAANTGHQMGGWFKREINTLDDFRGLRMRIPGLGGNVLRELGGAAVTLSGGEIYPALQNGTIDATEFSQPAIDLNLGFYQVAKHYYFPGWHQQSTAFELMINKEKWDAMTEQQKALLTMACRANYALGMAEGEAIQGAALKELEAKGVTLHRWPPEILAQYEATWNEVAAELAAEDASFKKAWDSLQAYRSDYKRWGELGYLK